MLLCLISHFVFFSPCVWLFDIISSHPFLWDKLICKVTLKNPMRLDITLSSTCFHHITSYHISTLGYLRYESTYFFRNPTRLDITLSSTCFHHITSYHISTPGYLRYESTYFFRNPTRLDITLSSTCFHHISSHHIISYQYSRISALRKHLLCLGQLCN